MKEFLDHLSSPNGGHITALVFFGGVAVMLVVALAIIQWGVFRRQRMEAALRRKIIDLKQQMIERGMSADDIERVLNAQPPVASQAGLAGHPLLEETADYKG